MHCFRSKAQCLLIFEKKTYLRTIPVQLFIVLMNFKIFLTGQYPLIDKTFGEAVILKSYGNRSEARQQIVVRHIGVQFRVRVRIWIRVCVRAHLSLQNPGCKSNLSCQTPLSCFINPITVILKSYSSLGQSFYKTGQSLQLSNTHVSEQASTHLFLKSTFLGKLFKIMHIMGSKTKTPAAQILKYSSCWNIVVPSSYLTS